MEDMRRGLDFEKAEAAFRRAAYKAVHGTREERSGRFLPAEEARNTSLNGKPKRVGDGRQKGTAGRGR
jgi:hypothetical protein